MSAADRVTPLWLSHHWPEDYDRCVSVAGRHVCRRCVVLYPIALVVTALSLAGLRLPGALEVVALVVLPLPALVDYVVEHLALTRTSPARLVALTVPLGIGLGIGFGRYLEAPGDLWFWGVVVSYALVALLALLTLRRRPATGAGPEG
jgi:uncharacterized membrane protein